MSSGADIAAEKPCDELAELASPLAQRLFGRDPRHRRHQRGWVGLGRRPTPRFSPLRANVVRGWPCACAASERLSPTRANPDLERRGLRARTSTDYIEERPERLKASKARKTPLRRSPPAGPPHPRSTSVAPRAERDPPAPGVRPATTRRCDTLARRGAAASSRAGCRGCHRDGVATRRGVPAPSGVANWPTAPAARPGRSQTSAVIRRLLRTLRSRTTSTEHPVAGGPWRGPPMGPANGLPRAGRAATRPGAG
jgi:hypothetical protein